MLIFLAQGYTYAQVDLFPTALTSPTNGCLLSANEIVEIRVVRGDNNPFSPADVTVITVTTTINGITYPAYTSPPLLLSPYSEVLVPGTTVPC